MRWRDLARLAVFTDPFTSLRRPVSDVMHPKDVILENDDFPVSRCGLDRVAPVNVAHVKHAYSKMLSGHFFSTLPIQETYSTRGRASSTLARCDGRVPRFCEFHRTMSNWKKAT